MASYCGDREARSWSKWERSVSVRLRESMAVSATSGCLCSLTDMAGRAAVGRAAAGRLGEKRRECQLCQAAAEVDAESDI